MVRHCVVRGCQPDRYCFRISQFQFPKDPGLRERWVKFVQLGRGSHWQPKHWHLMCSRHFPDACFDSASITRFKTTSNSRLVMLENAAPSLHGYLLGQGPVRVLDIDKVKVTEGNDVPESTEGAVEDYEDSWKDESSTLQQKRKEFLQQMQERMTKPPEVKETSQQRGPPDLAVPISELNALLTCGICKGYIINATTITECLHSFCRSCLINHVKGSVLCPNCSTVIHPSNPYSNMRADWTMQDIVFKIFPHVEKDEKLREAEFYRSRGLPWPPKEPEPQEEREERPPRPLEFCPSWVSLELKSVGIMPCTPTEGSLKTLPKCFIRVPSYTTLAHVKLFVEAKLNVHKEAQVYLFIENYVLHSSLTIEDIWNIFYSEEEEGVYTIQYGIVKSSFELFTKTIQKTKNRYHKKVKHWPEKPHHKMYMKNRQKGRPAKRGRRPGGPGRPPLKRLADGKTSDSKSKEDVSEDDYDDGNQESFDSNCSNQEMDTSNSCDNSNAQNTTNHRHAETRSFTEQEDEAALASFLNEELAQCHLNTDSRSDTPTLCQLASGTRLNTPTLESMEMANYAELDEAMASIVQML